MSASSSLNTYSKQPYNLSIAVSSFLDSLEVGLDSSGQGAFPAELEDDDREALGGRRVGTLGNSCLGNKSTLSLRGDDRSP